MNQSHSPRLPALGIGLAAGLVFAGSAGAQVAPDKALAALDVGEGLATSVRFEGASSITSAPESKRKVANPSTKRSVPRPNRLPSAVGTSPLSHKADRVFTSVAKV